MKKHFQNRKKSVEFRGIQMQVPNTPANNPPDIRTIEQRNYNYGSNLHVVEDEKRGIKKKIWRRLKRFFNMLTKLSTRFYFGSLCNYR